MAILAMLWSCGSSESGDEAGLIALAKELDASHDLTLVNSLKPTMDDLKVIFISEDDAKIANEMVEKQYGELSKMVVNPIHSKAGQTEVITRKGIVGGDLSAVSGGFNRMASKLKEGTAIYEIKYVEPGKTLGMKFSAFIYVNGKWKFFGKLYRAF